MPELIPDEEILAAVHGTDAACGSPDDGGAEN
jgi:hypothetical protein